MKKMILILFICVTMGSLYSQEVLDKVAAVVDNEIILKSELDFQTQLLAYQRKLNANDPKLKQQVLNVLIEDKLVLAQSEIDSVNVTEEEVNRQLDYQIEMFVQQYGSKEKMEQTYGMSIEKIKKELREDIRKKILVQKTQELHIGKIDVSRQEVEEFYKAYKDSLGKIPDEYGISQIFITPKFTDADKSRLNLKAKTILDSIKGGADFKEFARKYSDHTETAKDGGDLGFVKRGQFFKEFEEAAFTLKEGEISGVVETPLGYHLIQLVERRGDAVHVRHILFKLTKTSDSDSLVVRKLNDLRDSILNNKNSFEYYASIYSEDKQSADAGGDMGVFTSEELQPLIRQVVNGLKINEISNPVKIVLSNNNYGYQIVKLNKKVLEHKMNIDQDFDRIEHLALIKKKQDKYISWISKLKEQVYWEIRL